MRRPLNGVAAFALAAALASCGSDSNGGGGAAPDAATAAPDTAEPAQDGGPTDTGATPDTSVAVDPGPPIEDSEQPDVPKLDPVYGTPCPDNTRVGAFEIAHWDFYSSVAGEVAEGVIPLTVLQPVAQVGDCRLLRKENPFCDPPCGAGQLCDHDGSCVPYPANQSVGSVTVTGLKVPVSMEPNATAGYADTTVPLPMFDPGAQIDLTAAGDVLEGFSMTAWGVEELEVPEQLLTMTKGAPLDVSWTPWDGPARLYMLLNVDQHGNSPGSLICDVPDTGSYTIDAELITKLLELGVSGFATFDLYRRTVDSAMLAPGCVELRVFSYRPGQLSVEGHVPCFNDKECPDGETCDVAVNTCIGS